MFEQNFGNEDFDSTLWFFSSVSASVEISVLGLASAILDSPQFSVLPLEIETRFDRWFFSNGSLWDSTWMVERLKLDAVGDCSSWETK